MNKLRLILNGKKAGLPTVRSAIKAIRKSTPLDVRVTFEAGDVQRLVREACGEGCDRLVSGGGDGTVKETVEALMQLNAVERPELALLPLGTANDFATACKIPLEPLAALNLATQATAFPVDCVRANNDYFINVASGGFGAQVTANTPPALKNFLGGGAYTIAGLAQSLKFEPYKGKLIMPDEVLDTNLIISAICNGRQAGGGQVLAPRAMLNDGLLDILGLLHFPVEELATVIQELLEPGSGDRFVKRYRVPWAEWYSETAMPINLDGEPLCADKVHFESVPKAIKLALPTNCPLLQ